MNMRKWFGMMIMVFVLSFSFVCTSEAKTAMLTKEEKKTFSKYLNGGMKKDQFGSTYYQSKKQGILYNAKFYVYDINGDGHKDVIVSGALGLRSMTF